VPFTRCRRQPAVEEVPVHKSTPVRCLLTAVRLYGGGRQPDCRWWPADQPPVTVVANIQQAYSIFRGKGSAISSGSLVGQPAAGVECQSQLPGGGIAQWMGGRWQSLVNFAKQSNRSAKRPRYTTRFLWSELQGSESAGLRALQGANDVVSATQASSSPSSGRHADDAEPNQVRQQSASSSTAPISVAARTST